MSGAERLAAYVVHGELEKGEWDWVALRWKGRGA
jgi:hypothetical protein